MTQAISNTQTVEFSQPGSKSYDADTIVNLLLNASWSWEKCGENHRAESLDEQTDIIEENITENAILVVLEQQIGNIVSDSDFEEAADKNVFIAKKIADSVAQNLTDYDYEGVSYIANI